MNISIRQARPEDLPSIAALEAACFPPAEAAGPAAFEKRIETFPESFFVAEVEGQIVGMINGCVTDDETISDILFEDHGFRQRGLNSHLQGKADHLLRRLWVSEPGCFGLDPRRRRLV